MTKLDEARREMAELTRRVHERREMADLLAKHSIQGSHDKRADAFVVSLRAMGWGPLPEPVELTTAMREELESFLRWEREYLDDPDNAVGDEAKNIACCEAILNGQPVAGPSFELSANDALEVLHETLRKEPVSAEFTEEFGDVCNRVFARVLQRLLDHNTEEE